MGIHAQLTCDDAGSRPADPAGAGIGSREGFHSTTRRCEMAEALMQDLPEGFGQAEYDAVNEEMNIAAEPPDGLIFHSAGQGPTGAWRIVDIWESRDHFERFMQERLMPAFTEVSGQQPEEGQQPDTTWWPIHNTLIP